jgi:hypothetical protein
MKTIWPSGGACVYACKDSRQKAYGYFVNGVRSGYARVDDNGNPVGASAGPNRWRYTITPLAPVTPVNPEFQVVGVEYANIGAVNTPTYRLANPMVPEPNRVMLKEYKRKLNGRLHLRSDSSSVFKPTGDDLKQRYGGESRGFANAHDDEGDDGDARDSLSNFMEEMRTLPGNLDYFAYAGHGWHDQLPSAGLRMYTDEFTEFVSILRRILRPNGTIVFYTCWAGAVNGFAQAVSSAIPSITVFGHEIKGHGQTNPTKVRIRNGNRETFRTLLGDDYTRWARYIKVRGCSIWIRYPWMSIEDIRAEVRADKQLEVTLRDI